MVLATPVPLTFTAWHVNPLPVDRQTAHESSEPLYAAISVLPSPLKSPTMLSCGGALFPTQNGPHSNPLPVDRQTAQFGPDCVQPATSMRPSPLKSPLKLY